MKNKIVSAMLLGMSVSVAIPGAVVMALEDSAATQPIASEMMDTATADDARIEIETIDPVEQMESYGSDADAKAADTPDGFTARLVDIKIDKDVFGKYAEGIREYITGSTIDTASLYDAEMDAVNKASTLMAMEDSDAIDAARYHIALAFEEAFGESVFDAGRDIRRGIDTGKNELYAACATVEELDAAYGGVKDEPVTFLSVEENTEAIGDEAEDMYLPEGDSDPLKSEGTDIMYIDSTDLVDSALGYNMYVTEAENTDSEPADIDDVLIIQPYSTETTEVAEVTEATETTEVMEATETIESGELEDYCSNISDLVVTVGGSIQNSVQILDTSKVQSVTINANAVNFNLAGTYTINYIIVGTDGSKVIIDKTCTVTENEDVARLRAEILAKVDEISSDLTVDSLVKEWEEAVTGAKERINVLTESDDMQAIVDRLQETYNSLMSRQQLTIAKEGYIKELNEYCEELECSTETEKAAVEQARAEAVEKINVATTIQEAADALESGKESANQATGSLEAVKALALKKIDGCSTVSSDATSISKNAYDAIIIRLDEAKDATAVEAIVNSAQRVFADIKTGLVGAISGFDVAYSDLKGLSSDADTTETIGLIIANGTTTDIEDAEYRIQDICKALTLNAMNFSRYLSSRCGTTINTSTKVEAYQLFTQYFDDNALSNAKKAAVGEIREALEAVIVGSDSSLKVQKETLQKELLALIEVVTDTDGVASAKESALVKVAEFQKTVSSAKELAEAKTIAQTEVNAVVSAQTEAGLLDSLFSLAKTYNSAIEAAMDKDAVTTLLTEFKDSADTIIQKYAEDQALAVAVSETLAKIENLLNGVNGTYVTSEMNLLITRAQVDVKAASSKNECDTIYNALKTSFSDAYLKEMRNVYVTKTEALLDNDFLTGDTYIADAKAAVEKQVENINGSTNEDVMANCYTLAQKQVNAIVEEAKALATAKSEAVAKLKSGYSNPTDSQATVLKNYIDKINAATTTSEVSSLLSQAQDALKSSSGSGTGSDSTVSLEVAKTSALTYIKEMYESVINKDSVSSTDKEAATTIYNNYKSAIEAATTISQVAELKEKCASELEKYGANRPVENKDTTTTAGSGSGGSASEKAVEVSTAGTAKTGDNNTGLIAMALSAMMAAIAAAAASIHKFIRN